MPSPADPMKLVWITTTRALTCFDLDSAGPADLRGNDVLSFVRYPIKLKSH
jgi:hypothetical protein